MVVVVYERPLDMKRKLSALLEGVSPDTLARLDLLHRLHVPIRQFTHMLKSKCGHRLWPVLR